MGRKLYFICSLLICLQVSDQKSTPDSPSYIAAVVEFPPKQEASSELGLRENSESYVRIIKKAAEFQRADIIVFPEDGLTTTDLPGRDEIESWTTLVPAVSENYIPCLNDTIPVSQVLKNISCAAQQNQIYVVINIAEKHPCEHKKHCAGDNTLYYNTNVAFDRNGKIIARYRKTHLYLEPQFNVTTNPEIVTFDTDFGVTFGTFTCFDILFKEPALTLTRKHQITDIIFTTAWFSELPFLTATQMQAGWSYAEDVNFLASGYNRPEVGNSGSGIYMGRNGIAKITFPFETTEHYLAVDVLKKKKTTPSGDQSNSMKLEHVNTEYLSARANDETRVKRANDVGELKLYHDDITVFETAAFNTSTTKKICHNGFCCDFTVDISHVDPASNYRFVVFNGLRTYSNIIFAGTRVCAVVQCANDTVASCGWSTKTSETTFKKIEISGTFDNYDEILVMPNTLTSPSLLPLNNFLFEEHKHEKHGHVTISKTEPVRNVLTFGLYCREYSKDTYSAASKNSMHNLLSLATIMYFIFYMYN
ncbi:vanin-like protein 1 [Prorops nasuta]|uniref:vanin-like protein 1 n=1 Tax=Prorops nasuta TaxID=863751 RepID=UPI0034CD766E